MIAYHRATVKIELFSTFTNHFYWVFSTKNVGFFPDNFVGKEAQRQNVGNFAEKM